MKKKPLKLAVVDLDQRLAPEIVAALNRCAASPRERVRKSNKLLWRHDWRGFAVRYLRRVFPQAWIYKGGSHLAIHASPPPEGTRENPFTEAGTCLCRIVEVAA